MIFIRYNLLEDNTLSSSCNLKCAPEVIAERIALFEEDGTPRTEAVTKDDREHSQ
jgi:hypothetical protein